MRKLLFLLLLFTASASAQQMPERSAVRKGNRQYNKGNYQRSIERYREALEADPASFEATYNLGNALYKAELYDKSAETLQKAAADSLRSDAERAQAFYNLGNAQFKQQKYREALESYKQSLRLVPDDPEAKYNYAYTKRLMDENEEGGDDGQQEQNRDQNDKQDGSGNPQPDPNGDRREPGDEQPGDNDPQQEQPQEGEPQPVPVGISPREQEQMLDAIQAQEDKTQEKLKERQGVVIRGNKNW